MDQTLAALLTLPVLFFCVIIFLITSLFRRTTEFLVKIIANHIDKGKYEKIAIWFYKENVLPFVPIIFGGLLSYFIKSYPYPEQFMTSNSSRIIFGCVAGLISSFLYPRFIYYFRKIGEMKNARNENIDTDDSPLPQGDVLPKIDDKLDSPK